MPPALAMRWPVGLVGSMGVGPSTTDSVTQKPLVLKMGIWTLGPLDSEPCASFIRMSPDGALRLRDFALEPLLKC